jgi:hypothetical protein
VGGNEFTWDRFLPGRGPDPLVASNCANVGEGLGIVRSKCAARSGRFWVADLMFLSLRDPMTRPRFTLAQLMAIVLYLAFGFAALRNSDEFWASATHTCAIVLIAGALVGALVRKGRARTAWVGCTVFGWTQLLIVHLPESEVGGLGFGPIRKPLLLFEWATAGLQPYIKPVPPRIGGPGSADYLMSYEQVSQSLEIILFALIGAVLGRVLAVNDEPPNPGLSSPRTG